MWISKVTSILFVIVLLYPLAAIFYKMSTHQSLPATHESTPPPPPERADSLVTIVEKRYSVVTPFSIFERYLEYSPRRWIGILGLIAVTLVLALLVYTTLVPAFESEIGHQWEPTHKGDKHDNSHPIGTIQFKDLEGNDSLLRPDNRSYDE